MESPEWFVLNLTGSREEAVNACFYVLFCFYFRLAGFTYPSPLPEVDTLLQNWPL